VDLPQFHVAARLAASSKLKGTRRLMVAVAADHIKEPPKVAPLHFILSEGSQYVTSYKVTEKPGPESMSVTFVVPRTTEPDFQPFLDAALNCLKWKRPSDLWCVLPYLENGDNGLSGQVQEMPPPQFTASTEACEAMFTEPAKRLDCTDLWTALWRATRSDASSPTRGQRHVIVFSRSPEHRIAGHGLVSNVQTGRCRVRAISSVENPELQEFCKRTSSPFDLGSEEEIPELIRQTYLALQARYEIIYQPLTANPVTLKIRVQSPDGAGETVLPIAEASA
jgi:hypothetical protein